MTGYKCFTHRLCSPIQGGSPVWDGSLPFTTPSIAVDGGPRECSFGWNFCEAAEDALEIAGFWPDGWGVRLFRVEATDAITRGRKRRAASLSILEEASVEDGIRALSARWFGEHAEYMVGEQLAWHAALCRPDYDPKAALRGLRVALSERSLAWKPKRFSSCRDAWDAWDAWDARAARAALTHAYAATRRWIHAPAALLTSGLREAYGAGLGIALPTGAQELGWAMAEAPNATP